MRRASLRSLITPLTVVAAALLLANVIVFAAWSAPRWSSRLRVTGGSGGVAGARERIEPALRAARNTYGRLGRAEQDLEVFRERMVASAGGSRLLGMLDAAGDDVGIDLDDATLQYVPIEELGVLQLGITFPVSGRYEAVRRLLDELATLPVFLVIDGVGLQSFGAGRNPSQMVRVDLAVSVFLEDAELAAPPEPPPARPVVSDRELETLRRAIDDNDPQDIADAVLDVLAALPALPVDPDALVVDLERLERTPPSFEPRRNLFSVVLPPAPAPEVFEEPEVYVEPEPVLPVRLLGIVRIEGAWHASLTDDQRVYVVAGGAVLPNGVTVEEVGKDYARVSYRDRTTQLNLEGTR